MGPRLKGLIRRNGLGKFDGLTVVLSSVIQPSQGHLTMSGDITANFLEIFLLFLIAKHWSLQQKLKNVMEWSSSKFYAFSSVW